MSLNPILPHFHHRPLLYIAGPYTHPDPVTNTATAIAHADALATFGVLPVVPHLSMLWHLHRPHDLQWWYEYDLGILSRCDGLYRIPGESRGADLEVEWAQVHDLQTFLPGETGMSWGDHAPAILQWATSWTEANT